MYNESKAMKEIRDIRVKNHEITKSMSDKEYIKYVNEEAEKVMQTIREKKALRA